MSVRQGLEDAERPPDTLVPPEKKLAWLEGEPSLFLLPLSLSVAPTPRDLFLLRVVTRKRGCRVVVVMVVVMVDTFIFYFFQAIY